MNNSHFLTFRRKNKKSKFFTRRDAAGWVLLLPLVIITLIMVWRPTIMGMFWSFFRMNGYKTGQFIGVRNYYEVIRDTQFFPILLNTLQYVFWSIVIGFLPPLILAMFIDEMIHCKSLFRVIYYLPQVMPGITVMLLWYYIYYPDHTGLLNMLLAKVGMNPGTWLGDPKLVIICIVVSMTWSGFGGTVILYYAALQGVSKELYEAAVLDGAGFCQRIWYVCRPQISGLLILTFIKQIIGIFQILEQPMAMTGGGPNGASISIGFQLYRYGFVSNRVGHAMALGVIIFLILMVATLFYFRVNKKIEENY